MSIRIGIHGAAGRMGQRLVALAGAEADLKLVAALEHAAHARLGDDVGTIAGVGPVGVQLASTLSEPVDVVIDFSVPKATGAILDVCVEKKIPLVVATTGLGADQQEQIRQAARTISLLWAPSMSLAVNLAMKLAETAGRVLKDHPSGADVEIIERHHRFKEDAPSGTALKFGEIIAAVMGQTDHRHGRSGRPGQRPHAEIGYHALRVGDNPGQHTIVFGLLGETLELAVRATSRDCYAHGALAAARFLAGQKPGLYNMNDVLGL
ncbi:MAG TPA: 4-hydroxy-tetrahydrodipicolinate reductase [Pirellulales bacterium]|jgi:4-hydroxy-tetrahydrodipicolinate reductase|nr:4-hydroxy-tetrahydrodipicolinate reductase [Pirellulales bacterium]